VLQAIPAAQSHTANGEIPSEKPPRLIPIVSDGDRARTIRDRAYHLWEQSGKPDGIAAQEGFWFEAEKELAAMRSSS
jgi:hypothetical protein